MQKTKWIVLLALVCIFVMSIPTFAQLPTTNWPKFGRDYYNSGYNTAAKVIAKPALKLSATLGSLTVAPKWPSSTVTGISVGPDGNAYALDWYNALVKQITPSGTVSTWGNLPDCCPLGFNQGLTFSTDGTSTYLYVIQQSNATNAAGGPAENLNDGRRIYAIDQSLGTVSWYSSRCWERVVGGWEDGFNGYSTPAVGPDGSIYITNMRSAPYEPEGAFFAYDKTGTRKWCYNGNGLGEAYGTPAVKTVVDGGATKNVIYVSGGLYKDRSATCPSLYAIRDDGTSYTILWTYNNLFTTAMPVLSSDGSTVYVAGRNNWPYKWTTQTGGGSSRTTGRAVPGTLYSFNADTGVQNWVIDTGSSHAYQPALGPNGMIYVAGGYTKGWNNTSTLDVPLLTTTGKLIAVKDNGSSAEIKWTLPLPDDEVGETTNVVTINTDPVTMYVGTSNGRFYCVQDMGDHGQILWSFFGDTPTWGGNTRHRVPAGLAVADDGTLYTSVNNQIYAFDTSNNGFNPSSPVGISGTVKDANGDPVAGAWVAAVLSTATNAAFPLADNANRYWTKTNADGTYVMAPKVTGTYNIAATAVGYTSSDNQSVDFTTSNTSVSANFTLDKAKYNWVIGSAASATNQSSTNAYKCDKAVDGDDNTRFVTGSASSRLTIDLGSPQSISEAVINWWYFYGKSFTLDWSTDGTTWTPTAGVAGNIYTTTAGNGGFPQSWYAADPIAATPPYADNTIINIGGLKSGIDTIKFAPVTARYWSINITACASPNTTNSWAQTASYASIWGVELRDSAKAGVAVPNTIGAAKSAQDGDGVSIPSSVVTAVAGGGIPAGSFFIESADRTSGIRVNYSTLAGIGFGDKVSVAGRVHIDANGEKYITATSVARLSGGTPVVALGINNRDLATDKGQGLFVKTWGNVTTSDSTSFTITDGSSNAVKVLCDSITKPSNGSAVKVRGIAGKDASGTVLYMRNESVDLTSGTAEHQVLPLPGPYKYPREYAVCGPFADDQSATDEDHRLNYDFISAATGGALTETTIQPNLGDTCGDKTWVRGDASNDTLDFTKVSSTNTNCTFYAHLWIYSPTAGSPGMRLGSDDGLNVWVNGSPVWNAAGPRGQVIGGDYLPYFPLNAGFNSILFKVESGTGSFSLISQIIDESVTASQPNYGGGVPLLNLGYTLSKPAGF